MHGKLSRQAGVNPQTGQERLDRLLAALPAAVLVLDGDGRVEQLNPAATRLLGEAVQGQLWRDLVAQLFTSRALEGGALQLCSGAVVTLSTCPLGEEPGQILLLHDVTEERRLQQLLQHQRRLADMGRMAATLAHQIRTPLASALLYVSQLNGMRENSARQSRYTARALESLRGLEHLVSDMLLYASGGGGERRTVCAEQLLFQALEPLQGRLALQGIELECAIARDELLVLVNPTLVASALQNLITNAMQAMPEGGVLGLSIQCDGGAVVFSVSDSGPGIDESLQPSLFEPFVTHREGGNGLGLAVVRAVARAMGGEACCHSRPGEGSRFRLSLPLAEISAKARGGAV